MNSDIWSGLGGLSLAAGIFAFVFCFLLAILWIFVPFAIFGIKPLLRQLLAQSSQTNALLEQMRREPEHRAEVARIESSRNP